MKYTFAVTNSCLWTCFGFVSGLGTRSSEFEPRSVNFSELFRNRMVNSTPPCVMNVQEDCMTIVQIYF